MTDKIPFVPGPSYFRLQHGDVMYPFSEDEDGSLYGYGHLDKEEFAAAVNDFDREAGELIEEEGVTEADVRHRWALATEDSVEGDVSWVYVPADFARHPLVFAVTEVIR